MFKFEENPSISSLSYAVHEQTNKLANNPTNRQTNASDYITSTEDGGNKRKTTGTEKNEIDQ